MQAFGNEQQIKREICEVGALLFEKGMVAANDGNISVRVGPNEVWVTPTGVSKGFMTPDMLVKVNLDGDVLEGERKATSELKMHLRVYREREDVKAVVHAHPPHATAFAIAGIPLDQAIMPESVVLLGTIPLAEYGTPSTEEVPEAVGKYVRNHRGLLLENHGALTWGEDVFSAYFTMEQLEFTAKINWLARQIGGVRELSMARVAQLNVLRDKMGLFGETPSGVECPTGVDVCYPVDSRNVGTTMLNLSVQDLEGVVERVVRSVLKEWKDGAK